MCLVCKSWEMGKLTSKEAMNAIGELLNTSDDEAQRTHMFEVAEKILDSEMPEPTVDGALDRLWYEETHEKS